MNQLPHSSGSAVHATGLGARPTPNTQPLWAAIGVLGVCVLAMGASLVHINKRPAEPVAAVTGARSDAMALAGMGSAMAMGMSAPAGPVATESAALVVDKKLENSQAHSAQPATKIIAKIAPSKAAANHPSEAIPGHTNAPLGSADTAPVQATALPQSTPVVLAQAPAPVLVKPVCSHCGTIESVVPVVREGKSAGTGAAAGGVLGAVLGNQMGQGSGRAVATVLGAVGGGWAGNKIEKNMKKDTVYSVVVRMEDGTSRTLEQTTAPGVGAKVTVEGNTLRAADAAASVTTAPRVAS